MPTAAPARPRHPLAPATARAEVAEALGCVAPTADLETVEPDDPLWVAFDLDADDVDRFAEALVRRTGVRIEQADLPRLATLEAATAFLVVASRTRDLV